MVRGFTKACVSFYCHFFLHGGRILTLVPSIAGKNPYPYGCAFFPERYRNSAPCSAKAVFTGFPGCALSGPAWRHALESLQFTLEPFHFENALTDDGGSLVRANEE